MVRTRGKVCLSVWLSTRTKRFTASATFRESICRVRAVAKDRPAADVLDDLHPLQFPSTGIDPAGGAWTRLRVDGFLRQNIVVVSSVA